MVKAKIIYDESSKKDILEGLNLSFEDEYIVDNTIGKKVLTENGETISFEEFAGVSKSSPEIFIKKDIVSLIQFAKKVED